jgi:hypothetical protein
MGLAAVPDERSLLAMANHSSLMIVFATIRPAAIRDISEKPQIV